MGKIVWVFNLSVKLKCTSRAESLYTHGRLREACELSVKLAEEFLNHPEELIKEPVSLQVRLENPTCVA